MSTSLRASSAPVAGALVGVAAVPLDLLALVLALLATPFVRVSRRAADARSAVLDLAVAAHRHRLVRWLGWSPGTAPDASRTRYLAAHVVVGAACAGLAALLLYGVAGAVLVLASWLLDVRPLAGFGSPAVTGPEVAALAVPGALLLYAGLAGLWGVPFAERRVADALLAGRGRRALEQRVAELTASRAEIVAAVEAERRRVERDLHDGVQQHAVAVGMLIDRGRRAQDPQRREELLVAAHAAAEQLVAEVRGVARRVHPTALARTGLGPALEELTARADPPTTLVCDLAGRPPDAVERCVYYVVAEALTNVRKHARASACDVDVRSDGSAVGVRVRDDGVGGAGARAGGGLSGLAARVRAEGGTLTVTSPDGGPTVVEVTLPCAS